MHGMFENETREQLLLRLDEVLSAAAVADDKLYAAEHRLQLLMQYAPPEVLPSLTAICDMIRVARERLKNTKFVLLAGGQNARP